MESKRHIVVVEVDKNRYRYWYLICPTCGWFAPFAMPLRNETTRTRICSTCDTLLLWKGLEPSLDRLIKELRNKDPQASYKCGNEWMGFTSKLALTAIIDPNDIGWWIR